MSCHTSFYAFSVPHGVCGKARPAGNIDEYIAKGRNTATARMGCAHSERKASEYYHINSTLLMSNIELT